MSPESYAGRLVEQAKTCGKWVLEIVKRSDQAKGFQLFPPRWLIERTFAWLGRYPRINKDYEAFTATSEAMIRLAMIRLMLRRLANE